MTYTIPSKDGGSALVSSIEEAQDGDVIIVRSQEMKESAERAKKRMCPDKDITFEIGHGNA